MVVVATGGLSHQVHGERAGFNNPEWDMELLDLMENDPVTLTQLTIADYATAAGGKARRSSCGSSCAALFRPT